MAPVKPISSEEDYRAALDRIHEIFQAEPGSPESDELDLLVSLVELYEARHYPVDPLTPIEEIEYEMDRREVTLGEVLSFSNGKSSPERSDDFQHPVYGSNGVIGYSNDVNATGDTIIIGRVGSYCGSLYFSDTDCWVTDNAIKANTIRGNDAKFIYYLLRTLNLNDWRTGSGQPLLNQATLSSIPATVPNLDGQRVIAHVLGTLDDKIELNRRMNRTLEEMARAVFKDWFVDFGPTRAKMEGREAYLPPEVWDLFPERVVETETGEAPEGWEVTTLGGLTHKPQYGYTASAIEDEVGPKFLRITDINKNAWIDWSAVPHCEITETDSEKYRLSKGDVLIARMADPGHGVMIEQDLDAVFASYLIRFRPICHYHTRIIQYWMRSERYWDLVRSRGSGTTRASLNAKVLSTFPLVMPPKHIAEIFSDYTATLRNSVVANASEIQILSTLRDTLLPRLLSGELRVQGTGDLEIEVDV